MAAASAPAGGAPGTRFLGAPPARPAGRAPDDVAWASIVSLGLASGADPARLRYADGLKRATDLLLAAVLLLLLAPLLLAVMVAVRLDSPGPAVFRQRRVGRGGHPSPCSSSAP